MYVRSVAAFAILSGIAAGFGGLKLTRSGYESPAYTVVETADAVELRDYPALELVSTGYTRIDGADGSFMRLFRYIDGGNERSEKIEMTTPVLMTWTQKGAADGATAGDMSFVLPREVAASGAPDPTAAEVKLARQPARRYAVLRFATREEAPAAVAKLQTWLADRGVSIDTEGAPLVAFYDPPWTPAAFRRNEVLIPVKADAKLKPGGSKPAQP